MKKQVATKSTAARTAVRELGRAELSTVAGGNAAANNPLFTPGGASGANPLNRS